MNTTTLRVLGLAVLFGLAGCEQGTTPSGTPSEATVRAYVDVDGSGTFSAGDVPLSGMAITLRESGGDQTITATTDAQGIARFPELAPGSYSVTMAGTAPTGAELATATAPVLVAPFHGGAPQTEFRFVYRPATIQGVVFRDDDGSGSHSPGDAVAQGVLVSLYSGTEATGTPVDTVRTDAQGAFTFQLLRPGQYTIGIAPLPGITLVDGPTQQVQVQAGQQVTVPVRFTGSLRMDIAVARTMSQGQTVAVEGVATVGTGPMGATTLYVQDATGGIMVFGPTGTSVQTGDRIRVTGPLGNFGGELQIGVTATRANIEILGPGVVPAPRVVTGAQVAARTFEGQLARVNDVEIVSVGGGTGAAFTVVVRAQDGTEFQVRVSGAGTGLTRSDFVVGQRYDIDGLLGSFNGVAQLKPRSPADVRPAGTINIAIARQRAAAGDSSVVVLEGVATVGTGILGATTTTTYYIQDASGGIMVFGATGTTVATGTRVRVTAPLGHFGRELQLGTSASRAVTEILGAGTVPAPRTVTGAQVVARVYEGELARAENVEVISVAGGTGAAFDVEVRDAAGTEFRVRVSGAGTALTRAHFVVGNRYDITGLLGSFNDVAQLKPRSPADVVPRS